MSPRQFIDAWKNLVAVDPILRSYLREMRMATVVHGTDDGQISESVDLLLQLFPFAQTFIEESKANP
jgi:hypothetical protein